MGMGTVQAVYVIEKHTEKCSSKQKERKAFALIFNKHVMSFSFIRLKKKPNQTKNPQNNLILFPKYEEASLVHCPFLFLVPMLGWFFVVFN